MPERYIGAVREKVSPTARSADESGSSDGGADAGGPGVPGPGGDIESVIDEDTFSQLEAALGDRAALRAVLQMYLDDLPIFVRRIREAVDAGQPHEARAAVHRLKGNAGMIGGWRLAEACRGFEAALPENLPRLAELAARVIAESERVASVVQIRADGEG